MAVRWFYYKATVVNNEGKRFRFVFMNYNKKLALAHARMVSGMYGYGVENISRLDNETGRCLINGPILVPIN